MISYYSWYLFSNAEELNTFTFNIRKKKPLKNYYYRKRVFRILNALSGSVQLIYRIYKIEPRLNVNCNPQKELWTLLVWVKAMASLKKLEPSLKNRRILKNKKKTLFYSLKFEILLTNSTLNV